MKKPVLICIATISFIFTIVAIMFSILTIISAFKPLDYIAASAATCTEQGNIDYYKNPKNGLIYSDNKGEHEIEPKDIIIPALGHDLLKVNAKAPTNTQDGNREYYHCKRCGNNYDDKFGLKQLSQVIIPAYATRGLEYNLIDERSCSVQIIDNAPREIKIDAIYEHDDIEYIVTTITADEGGNHDKVTSIELPNTIEDIRENAFKGFPNLESITFGDNSQLYSIGEGAFEDCKNLTSVTIPAQVNTIGNGAFKGCAKLTNITIPDNVTSIGADAFSGCTNIKTATISALAIGYIPQYNLQTVVVTSGDSIGDSAFCYCESLESITIPDSVISIVEYAFFGCESLKSIEIPNGVTSIGEEAFSGCTSLESVTFGNNSKLETIGEEAFSGCTSLESVTFGNNSKLETIGRVAFAWCRSLESITIPDSVTSIGEEAFSGCTNLKNVTIGNGVTSIGDGAFQYCTSLKEVIFKNTAGWQVSASSSMSSAIKVTVTDSAQNAKFLTQTYVDYTWKREEN